MEIGCYEWRRNHQLQCGFKYKVNGNAFSSLIIWGRVRGLACDVCDRVLNVNYGGWKRDSRPDFRWHRLGWSKTTAFMLGCSLFLVSFAAATSGDWYDPHAWFWGFASEHSTAFISERCSSSSLSTCGIN